MVCPVVPNSTQRDSFTVDPVRPLKGNGMPAKVDRSEWPGSLRMCLGKKKYLSSQDAWAAVRRAVRASVNLGASGAARLSAYLCDQCGYWHMGKSSPPKDPNLAQEWMQREKRINEYMRSQPPHDHS